MFIIPAIDLISGKVVRLTQGDYSKVKVYSENPVDIAKLWKDKGAEYLHIVDLDGAKRGKLANLKSVKEVIDSVDIKVELGGGIRDLSSINEALDIGVTKVVLGTAVFKDKVFAKECVSKFGEKVVFSIDARNKAVSLNGWTKNAESDLYDFIKLFESIGLKRIIYTESHDEVANGKARVPQQVSGHDPGSWIAKKLSTLGAALVFTAPGIPMIFQGQEFLEDEWFRDEDPLDWTKLERYAGIHRLYCDLIRLRRNLDGNTQGLCGPNIHLFHVNHQDKVLAFKRSAENAVKGEVVVVVNFAAKERLNYRIGLPQSGTWTVGLNTDHRDYDADFGNLGPEFLEAVAEAYDNLPCSATLDIGPFSVLILLGFCF